MAGWAPAMAQEVGGCLARWQREEGEVRPHRWAGPALRLRPKRVASWAGRSAGPGRLAWGKQLDGLDREAGRAEIHGEKENKFKN
jgi:hypothetical protein